jgi:hypothetical protein
VDVLLGETLTIPLLRAERVRLALVAYRIDHREYPEKLEELVPTYATQTEVTDLFTGAPLGWAPKGFALPLAQEWTPRLVDQTPGGRILAKTPVLWSSGLDRATPREGIGVWNELANALVPAYNGDDGERTPAMLLQGREAFAIPVPK